MLLARHLLRWSARFPEARKDALEDVIGYLQALAYLRSSSDQDNAQDAEEEVLLQAGRLQLHVQHGIAEVRQRTLDLDEQCRQAGDLYTALATARNAIQALRNRIVRPPQPTSQRPSLLEFRRWQDHALNKQLARRAKAREEVAKRAEDSSLSATRWRISVYEPNGYFEAVCETDTGQEHHYRAWVPVPDAVPALLRRWSVPAQRPVEVIWDCLGPWPHWLLPYGGDGTQHRGADPEHRRGPSADLNTPWLMNPAHRERLAAMIEQVRRQRPDGVSVDGFLRQAADHLNAVEPIVPGLGHWSQAAQRHEGDLIGLGTSKIAGWIDPAAAVAFSGTPLWNGFDDHRPDTVPAMIKAMWSGSVETALTVWNWRRDPICVDRVPGPVGPLYELGRNGTHRLHAARLLGLPAIWAEITQDALPLQITPYDLGAVEDHEAEQVVTCWRGLLAAGLVVGELEHCSMPRMTILHIDDTIAAWILAEPVRAVAWAAAYDRVYPDALRQAGIPPHAWTAGQAWVDWCSTASR
ncbi:hypothetical protein ABZ897_43285 [Nonomuraea sp. NPDC046802]|uniref:hypothetical protein n=1 Tax=Nonomuraea sp. NPDC046802 TaxID=3154919 RepID=UPI003410AE03